jgi:hypothetical protein
VADGVGCESLALHLLGNAGAAGCERAAHMKFAVTKTGGKTATTRRRELRFPQYEVVTILDSFRWLALLLPTHCDGKRLQANAQTGVIFAC